jgi:SMP-30/Gluconolactonase/LRE-like region
MRRTNGIDLSPDEKTLYLTEANTVNGVRSNNVIWAYNVDIAAGTVWNKRLFVDFGTLDGTAMLDSDGMRTDTQGERALFYAVFLYTLIAAHLSVWSVARACVCVCTRIMLCHCMLPLSETLAIKQTNHADYCGATAIISSISSVRSHTSKWCSVHE